jgi:hypothetical protein
MAVSVNYRRPVFGVTPPTQLQTQRLSTVVAVLAGTAAADSQAIITHNLNMSNADISQGFPTLDWEPLDTTFYAANWFEASQSNNFVVLQKGAGVGATANNQAKVTISRPNTTVR